MNAKKEWKWILNECNIERPKWSYEGRDQVKREMVITLQVLLSQYQDAKKSEKRFYETANSMMKGDCLTLKQPQSDLQLPCEVVSN